MQSLRNLMEAKDMISSTQNIHFPGWEPYKQKNTFSKISSTIMQHDSLSYLLDFHPKWLLAVPKYQIPEGTRCSSAEEVQKNVL